MSYGLEYVLSLKDRGFSSTADKAKRSVNGLDEAVNQTNKHAGGMGSTLKKAGKAVGFAILIDQARRFAVDSVKVLSNLDKLESRLAVTFGNKDVAKGVLRSIEEFATKTPYEIDKVTESYLRLASDGFAPTEKEMTKLGDLAASRGKGIDQLSNAIAEAQMGQFTSLKDFGIAASKSGDQVSFSFKGIQTTVNNSEKSIRDYILSLGDMKGVTGSMAEENDKISGKINQFGNMLTQTKRILAESFRPELNALFDTGMKVVGWIKDNIRWIKPLIKVTGTLAIGIAAITAAQWAWNIAMDANPIGLIIVGVAALAIGIKEAYDRSEKFRQVLHGIGQLGIEVFKILKETVSSFVGGFQKLIDGDFKGGLKDIGSGLMNMRPSAFVEHGKRLKEAFNRGWDSQKGTQEQRDGKTNKNWFDVAAGLVGNDGGSGGTTDTGKTLQGPSASVAKAESVKNITVNINKLVERLEFVANDVKSGTADIRRELSRALVGAVRDFETSIG